VALVDRRRLSCRAERGNVRAQHSVYGSHIIEKTGGGASFETYIAINHSRHTAIFLAATDGSVATHLNLFNAANKLLLALAGLPPIPSPPTKQAPKRWHPHRRRNR
jgi:D-alanyl-D-alanine-carboxypeptidase/D-alanyl-D-alanine-endopeptidase